MDPAEETTAGAPRHRRDGAGGLPDRGTAMRGGLVGLAGSAVVVALLGLCGYLPMLIGQAQTRYYYVGFIQCAARSWSDMVTAHCGLIAGDQGADIANGTTFVALGAFLVRTLGLSGGAAYVAAAAIVMGAAFAGCYRLARLVGLDPAFAFVVATVYLGAPGMLGLHGFGATFWGVALVPAAVFVSLVLADGVSRWSWPRRVIGILAWASAAAALALMDGYGFVMATVAGGTALVCSAVRRPLRWRPWLGIVGFGVAHAAAVAVHRLVVPESTEWVKSSIDLFRSMGADLVTLVLPTGAHWWSAWAPATADTGLLWGDGSNARTNYLGVLLLGLAVLGAVVTRRSSRWVLPLAAAGGVALLFALGPSLKVNEIRGPLEQPITYKSYLMPPEAAVVELPTTWVYENVPGFQDMRATYRWINVTRLVVVILGAAGIQYLWKRRSDLPSRAGVGLICAVAVLEIAPNVGTALDEHAAVGRVLAGFASGVVEPMEEVVAPGTRVVFAPRGRGGNDFLATYLASTLGAPTYNAAGDKVLEAARAAWPEPVRALLDGEGDFSDATARVLQEDLVDAVVIPYFDLHRSASQWPISLEYAEPGHTAAEDVHGDDRLTVAEHEHFAVVTLSEDAALVSD